MSKHKNKSVAKSRTIEEEIADLKRAVMTIGGFVAGIDKKVDAIGLRIGAASLSDEGILTPGKKKIHIVKNG